MLLSKTRQYQSSLAQFCRTSVYVPIPGVNDKNIGHYRRLVFNNVLDSLSSAYPLTRKLFGKKKWEELVNQFFSSHDIQSPQIWYMPKEFKEYVNNHKKELVIAFPFLSDLLEFEWLEIEVFMMLDVKLVMENSPHKYFVNPEIRLIKVAYPVHLKNVKTITEADKGCYFMAIYRNPISGAVQFHNLSVPFVVVLENLIEGPLSEKEIISILNQYAEKEIVKNAFAAFENNAIANFLIFKS